MKIIPIIRASAMTILLYLVYKLHNTLGFGWGATSLYNLNNLLMFLYYYITFELAVNILKMLVSKK